MTIITLLVGIVMAAMVFAALFWSLAQLFQAHGALRLMHGATIVGIILGALALSNLWISLAPVIGVYLAVAATATAALEKRWSRLLPLFALAFAVALILGLPFQGV